MTTFFSWRWALFVEIFILAIMLALSGIIPTDIRNEHPPKLDRTGVALQAGAMVLLVLGVLLIGDYGLFFAKQPLYIAGFNLAFLGLSPALYSLMSGVILTLLFIKWERHLEGKGVATLLKLGLFANRVFSKGIQIASIQTRMIAGLLFTVPFFLQVTYGFNPFQSGLYLLPLSASVLVFSLLGVRWGRRMSMRTIMLWGWLIVIFSAVVLLLRMSEGSTPNELILGIAIFGIGMGLLASQTANVVMSSVERQESAEASGALNTFQQVGSSVGVAILGAVLSVTLIYNLTTGVEQSTIPEENKGVIVEELRGGVEIASTEYVEQAVAGRASDEQADAIVSIYSGARSRAFQVRAVTMGFFAVIALIMTTDIPKDLKKAPEEEET